MSSDEGRPLPPKPGIEQFLPDPQRTRPMVPQKGMFETARETLAERKARETDDRVREAERARHADWFRRRYGKAITEAEYPAHLQDAQ